MAARARAKNGVRRGLLDGVPISWKNLFDSAGVVTKAGSMLLEGRVPRRRCRGAGGARRGRGPSAVGKTHMSETGLCRAGSESGAMAATPIRCPARHPM